jgi:hypothetical protein
MTLELTGARVGALVNKALRIPRGAFLGREGEDLGEVIRGLAGALARITFGAGGRQGFLVGGRGMWESSISW